VLATYGAAVLIIVASLLVGRAFLTVLGRRETWWLETSVGLAILIVVCSVLTRVPGHGTTSVIGCAILVLAAIAYTRFSFADRESFLIATPVVLLTLLFASLPFIASGHVGIPGVGVNNDMASHLVWADWLRDPIGPTPQGIADGYPVGPHSLVATLAQALGTEPLYPFLGLLVALPVITALTSLNLLQGLPAVRRTLAATLVGVAYLTASTFGTAGFKELCAGVLLLSFVLILRTLTREEEGRFALIAGLGALLAAMIATYSYPGLLWPMAAAGVWIAAELLDVRRQGKLGRLRDWIRRNRGMLIGAAVVLLALAATQIPRLIDFYNSGIFGEVRNTASKLRFPINPFEALGVWPSGEFTFGADSTFGLDAWWIYAALGTIALVIALVWWVRRDDLTLPAAFAGSLLVYLATVVEGGRYVQLKAITVPAALIMLLIVGALLAREGGTRRIWLAVPFMAIAFYSSFLGLRDSVVAPTQRFDELRDLRSDVEGQKVLSLTGDRFADYGLRGAEVYSPAANVEHPVQAAVTKNQRLPLDFDSAPSSVLNDFALAITTSAPYQSQPPPGWTLVKSTDSYRLYRREGTTPPISILYEEARPGRVFRCQNPKLGAFLGGGGEPYVWPRPVIAKRLYWKRDGEVDNRLAPGEEASQTMNLPPGDWTLSIQYASPVAGIEVEAPGLAKELPPGVEASIPFRPDQGPYWTVGEVTGGGPVEVTVRADSLSAIQRLLGVDAPAVIGNVTAVQTQGNHLNPLAASCGLYVDHIIGAKQKQNTAPPPGQKKAPEARK
jgi:hypothetical protein